MAHSIKNLWGINYYPELDKTQDNGADEAIKV